MASNAAGTDDLGERSSLTGIERKGSHFIHVASVANETGVPLLSTSTAAAESAAQSRLSIGWGVPAPNWLLAFSSGAFFFLAFFASCQYRRRVPRVHIRRKDDGAALSNSSPSSSGAAPPSLPDVSKEAVLRSVSPSISDARTPIEPSVGDAFRALQCGRAGPLLPLCVASVFKHQSNIFLSPTHTRHTRETSATPCSVVPIVASSFSGAYPSTAKRFAANVETISLTAGAAASAAATSAARGTAAHRPAERAAARGMLCASYAALPLGRMDAGHYRPSPSEIFCKCATRVAANSCAAGSYADKVTASAVWGPALKMLFALPSAAPSISTSSVPSTVTTPLSSNAGTLTSAATMAAASRLLCTPGGFAFSPSTDGGHISKEADWTRALPHAATGGHGATTHLSLRLPSPQTDIDPQNEGIMQCVAANNNSNSASGVLHNPTATSYNVGPRSVSTSFSTFTHGTGACAVFSSVTRTNAAATYHTSGTTPAAAAAVTSAAAGVTPAAAGVTPAAAGVTPAAAAVTPATAAVTPAAAAATMPAAAIMPAAAAAACHVAASRRSSIIFPPCSSLKDYCAASPHLLFAREIVLHGAAPSGRRKKRPPCIGRDFSAHGAGAPDDVKKERSVALGKERRRRLSIQIPADVQMTPKVRIARDDGVKMKRGLAAAGARGGGAAAGLGQHTFPPVDGGEAPSPTLSPRDVRIGAVEEKKREEEEEAQARYSMLAMNEEDLPVSSCHPGPLFVFDGASTRSWILAFVAVAALLRGLLLLLQLVANPLEISRSSSPCVTVPLPAVRSSFPSFSVPVALPPVRTPFLQAASTSWPRDGIVAGGKQTLGKKNSRDTVSIPSSPLNGNLSALDASKSISFSTRIDAPHTDGNASSISLRFIPEEYSLKKLLPSAGARPVNPQARDASNTPATGLFSNNRTIGDAVSVPASLVQHSSSAPVLSTFVFLPATYGAGAAAVPAETSDTPSSDVASASSSDLAPVFSTKRLLSHAKSIYSVKPAPPHAAAPQSLSRMESTAAALKRRRHLEAKTVGVASDETFAARSTLVNVSTPPAAFTAYYPKIPQDHRFSTLSTVGKASVGASATAAASADFAQKYTFANDAVTGQYTVFGNDMPNVPQLVAKELDEEVSKTSGQHGKASECNNTCVYSSSVACSSCDLPKRSRRTESNSSSIDSSSTYTLVARNWSDAGKTLARIDLPANIRRSESSNTDGRSSRTKTKHKNSGDSKPQPTRISGKQRKKRKFHWKRRPTTTPPTSGRGSERSSSPGRGQTRWPSARWLRTLARSLPPMLSLEAYAFLILFLMDLFYASSRLESMQWIAVGSYIFLGGVWVLFGCIAGLTVAEDSTRREAAHLFARSVCWLLGSCFTLLAVSLAVVGTLVLQQLRGRASTHLFFPPSVVLRHPHVVVDSSLSVAPAASNVYPLPGAGLFRWAAALFEGEGGGGAAAAAAKRPVAAWNDDPYRCAYTGRRHFYTRRLRKQLYDAAPASRSEALLSACRVEYRSPELVAESLEEFGDNSVPGTVAPAQYPGNFQRDTSCSGRPASSLAEREHLRLFEQGKAYACVRQAERRAGYRAQNRSSLFVVPMNFFYRAFFRVRENARRCSYGGEPSGTACSVIAWRRLFMLTLCCPPLLLMRGAHMLLVGAQVFPHYYPSVIEEKDTLDVLIYLVTEWVPLTLLVCALSTTADSQRSRNSTASHASLQECEDNSPLPAMHHVPSLRASQRLHQRPNNYRESSGASERPWCCRPARKVESTVPASIHLPSCPLYVPFSAATVCAGRAQPLDSEQRTVQKYCREVGKQYAMADQSQSNLCDKQKRHSKTLGETQCTDDLASRNVAESSSVGQRVSKMKQWKRILYQSEKMASEILPPASRWKEKSYDEQLSIPLLTMNVVSGRQALCLAGHQHASSSSCSDSSRSDSENCGRRCVEYVRASS